MSASIDQNVTDQSGKAANGTLNPEYEYIQNSPEAVPESSEYSLAGSTTVDATTYVPAHYYTPYVYATAPATGELAWSTAADPTAYYAGYLSPGTGVYDYAAQATPGYGWISSFGDYAAWGLGMTGDGSTLYTPEGYYAAVEPYANGELEGSAGDAQISSLEQSVKMMGLTENGYCDGLSNSQLPDMSVQPKSWSVISGHTSNSGYKSKRVSVGLNRAMIDSGSWSGSNAMRYTQMPGAMDRTMPYRSGIPSKKLSSDPSMAATNSLVEKLHAEHQYNPKDFNLNPENARFFVIKSYSEDDIHRSIKYGIWCSTDYGNKRLDAAFNELNGKGPLYLFFSVNGSGHFCGVAEMCSAVDYSSSARVWAQDKWKGQFKVRWIYVKDVPNSQLRHIRLENNEGKPVTNSRDTQEVPPEKGKLVLSIIHNYRHTTSIFDDFVHYEKRQEECDAELPAVSVPAEDQRS